MQAQPRFTLNEDGPDRIIDDSTVWAGADFPDDRSWVHRFDEEMLVLHARTEYRDAPGQRRKLLRLWLDDESSRRLGPGKMDWYLPEHSRFTRLGGLETLPR